LAGRLDQAIPLHGATLIDGERVLRPDQGSGLAQHRRNDWELPPEHPGDHLTKQFVG